MWFHYSGPSKKKILVNEYRLDTFDIVTMSFSLDQSIMFHFVSVRLVRRDECIVSQNNNFHKYWYLPFADCSISLRTLLCTAHQWILCVRIELDLWFYETAGANNIQQKINTYNRQAVKQSEKKNDKALASVWSWPHQRQKHLCAIVIIIFLFVHLMCDGVHPNVRDHTNFFSRSLLRRLPVSVSTTIITISFRFLLIFFTEKKSNFFFSFLFVFQFIVTLAQDAQAHTTYMYIFSYDIRSWDDHNRNCCPKNYDRFSLHLYIACSCNRPNIHKYKQNESNTNCGGGDGCFCWCPRPNPIFGAYKWKGHAEKTNI